MIQKHNRIQLQTGMPLAQFMAKSHQHYRDQTHRGLCANTAETTMTDTYRSLPKVVPGGDLRSKHSTFSIRFDNRTASWKAVSVYGGNKADIHHAEQALRGIGIPEVVFFEPASPGCRITPHLRVSSWPQLHDTRTASAGPKARRAQAPQRRSDTRKGHEALARGVVPGRPRPGMVTGGAGARRRSSTARRPNADLSPGGR